MTRIIVFIILITTLGLSGKGVARDQRHHTCYRTHDSITADGLLKEPCWARAEWSSEFVDITGDPALKPQYRTRFKMLWDDNNIYLAAELQENDIWATLKNHDDVIFHDNDFELFIDPDGSGQNYFEIEVNAMGTIWDLMLTRAYKDHGIPVSAWGLPGMKTGVHINGSLNDPSKPDTSWVVEMVLPIQGLMAGKLPESRPSDGVQWRMNFSRGEWKTDISNNGDHKRIDPATGKPLPEMNWVWSAMGEVSMHIPDRWGRVEFSSEDIIPETNIKNRIRNNDHFTIHAWMGGHGSWNDNQWDSLFSLMDSTGIRQVLTQADPATLQKMIPAAHRHGIKVEKWFVAMMNNDPDLIKSHPDWFVINRDGKSSITDPAYVGYYRFLCPSNPQVLAYLKLQLDPYLAVDGLDGIHLDYIRFPDVILPRALWDTYNIVQDREYPPYDYCYCRLCRDAYKHSGGADPLQMAHPDSNAQWRQFRYNRITSVVKDLTEYVHLKGKQISAAVFPGPGTAQQLVRQQWDKWPLDEVMPMLYQGFYYGSLDWIRAQTAEGVTALKSSVPLYSGLYIPSLSPREFQTALSKSLDGGANGICLFTVEAMTPAHWKVLKK
jgi:uncharacterized lipoprotein YddW (UPF0748 family)